jgi:hypothetical protein
MLIPLSISVDFSVIFVSLSCLGAEGPTGIPPYHELSLYLSSAKYYFMFLFV